MEDSQKLTLRLIVTVTYDQNGVPEADLLEILGRIPLVAFKGGRMSNKTAKIDVWSYKIEEVIPLPKDDKPQDRSLDMLLRDTQAAIDQFDALAKMESGGPDGNTPLSCMDEPMLELIGDIDWQGVADTFRHLRNAVK